MYVKKLLIDDLSLDFWKCIFTVVIKQEKHSHLFICSTQRVWLLLCYGVGEKYENKCYKNDVYYYSHVIYFRLFYEINDGRGACKSL